MSEASYDLVGIGRAFTDVLAEIDDSFLKRTGLIKGRGVEAPPATLLDLRSQLETYTLIPGGSPSNTVAGLAALGGRGAFLGKVCDDGPGRAFRNAFGQGKVFFPNDLHPASPGAISATCLVLSTPDDSVTMAYNRGVADRLTEKDVFLDLVSDSQVLLIQGHLFISAESRDAVFLAAKAAQRAKRKVAVTMNDLYLKPGQDHSFLREADFLIGNRKEFDANFPGTVLEDWQHGDALFVITQGAEGARLSGRGKLIHVPTVELVPDIRVATPNYAGAGDQFAAGFLFGYTHDLSYTECARLGSETAAAVMRAAGARPKGDWSGLAVKYLAGSGSGNLKLNFSEPFP